MHGRQGLGVGVTVARGLGEDATFGLLAGDNAAPGVVRGARVGGTRKSMPSAGVLVAATSSPGVATEAGVVAIGAPGWQPMIRTKHAATAHAGNSRTG